MKMYELVSWFQLEYPYLVQNMKNSNHHLTTNDCLQIDQEYSDPRCKPQSLNPYHLESDVWTHTMMVCKQAENAPYEVQIAALLHDIGKPSTRAVNPKNGRVSFYNHDAVSAFMSLEVLKRPELGLSKEQQIRIFNAIALHTQVFKSTPDQLALTCINDMELQDLILGLGQCDDAGRFTNTESRTNRIEQMGYVVSKKSLDKEKEVVVLCGLPGSGKSTWVHNNVYNRTTGETSMIVSRDHYFAEHFPDLDYNDAWKSANQKMIDRWMTQKFAYARKQPHVIIDMTHMSKKSRRKSLSHFDDSYKKKCVVFLTDLPENYLRNNERDGKIIEKEVIERMMRSFYPPTFEEFDEIEYII